MKTKLLAAVCLASLTLVTAANANPYLSGGTSCSHVIDLLLRHGNGQGRSTAVLPHGGGLLLGESIGDLELISVSMVDVGNETTGPSLAITVRNNSPRDVHRFSVTAVALLGRITPYSPSTTQRVKCVAAGEAIELQLCLPIDCLSMGRAGNEALQFGKLVVAIDSFDELLETSESNNLLIIDRAKIPLAAAVAPAPDAAPAQPEAVAPVPQPSAPQQQAPATPEDKLDKIDFEKLGIE